ncbi:alkaline phosphatase [Flavivirga sp. 57AJ16]|uniref:alkaline phosphatase n=1 Tax=Flavivirga sp. 57AJ16 TaxID=3025307 RepID=UPI002366F121|nr:alkaline phosphatase [Flavivirga sp. 57AJ16]MDD7886957.1 alkaline phosphatase [Flavivirga sp. 57AJ16]
MLNRTITLFFVFFLIAEATSQEKKEHIKIHSHNDYAQKVPFWTAYNCGLNSIEIDVFLKQDTLFVTHSENEISSYNTVKTLYFEPLQTIFDSKAELSQDIQLLVDIKSEAVPTLKSLIEILESYPKLINSKKLSFVISGNQPKPETFITYPSYIKFDYQSLEPLSNEDFTKVGLISLPFRKFSIWNGKGRLTREDYTRVSEVIEKAHSYKKPFRFWGCPDSKTAWKAFIDLGVDFINTDLPYEASSYIFSLKNRTSENTFFSEVYYPTFEYDKKNLPVENIILLIGDGNGLAQISAATLSNNGNLTLTQLKSIGFIKTQSADDFTTDSAAAGTAIATGEITYNRSIGMDVNRKPIENITELLFKYNYNTGIITTDNVSGATPSSFYAHQLDRDMSDDILEDLSKSKISLIIGGGSSNYSKISYNFDLAQNLEEIQFNKSKKLAFFFSEGSVPSINSGRSNILSKATKSGLQYLKNQNKPFLLMVEGAQIDSFGHFNDISGIVKESIDFDKAITEAIKYADMNKNTLVIITADHETSGLSIPQGSLTDNMVEGDFSTNDHTGIMVPIFAYGPQSDKFTGVYNNNEIFHKIKEVLNIR